MAIRKLLCLALTLTMVVGLAACGKKDASSSTAPVVISDPGGKPAKAEGELGDSIYDFQAEIDGTVYSFPCPMQELLDEGWAINGSDDETLDPNAYAFGDVEKGQMELTIYAVNTGVDTLPLEECEFGGINVSDYDELPDITFPGGIKMGDSYQDVIDAYGEPSDLYEGSSKKLTYKTGTYASAEITVDADDTITGLQMRSLEKREDKEVDLDNLPPEVDAYSAPSELGSNWNSFTVEYGGDLYQLPAPLAEFIRNGWTLTEADDTIPAKGSATVKIRKDNQTLRTRVQNYSTSAQPPAGCFVTSVSYSSYDTKVSLKLPGGISEASTKAEVEKAYGTPDDTYEGSNYTSYTYGEYGEELSISFNSETGAITEIELEHSPREFPY